jgi:amidase
MSHTFKLMEATIDDVHTTYEEDDLTCRELVGAYLDRIEAYDEHGPELNAIININPRATERADDLDATFEANRTTR